MTDYIANQDTIIFSPVFNGLLNHLILINYKKIIFSNYELTESLFDAYENSNFSNEKRICSNFNIPLTNSLSELINVTLLSTQVFVSNALCITLKNEYHFSLNFYFKFVTCCMFYNTANSC